MTDALKEYINEHHLTKQWKRAILISAREDTKRALKKHPNDMYIVSGDYVRDRAGVFIGIGLMACLKK